MYTHILCYDSYCVIKLSPTYEAYRAALISIAIALSQTPLYIV